VVKHSIYLELAVSNLDSTYRAWLLSRNSKSGNHSYSPLNAHEHALVPQIPLSHPRTPRLPQLLRHLAHLHFQHALSIPRQFRIVPIAHHISLEFASAPASPIPKERDITRRVATRGLVNTCLLT